MPNSPRRIREPVQVYLDPDDRAILLEIAGRTGLSQAEVLRRGIRRLAADLTDHPPGASLDILMSALGDSAALPPDLAARHDEYLYSPEAADAPGRD